MTVATVADASLTFLMCHIYLNLSFNFFDFHHCQFLAMAHRAMVPFAALHLESDRLRPALMFNNIGQNRGVLERAAMGDLAVTICQEDLVERKCLTRLGGETFN